MMEEIFELVGKIRVDMSGLDGAMKKVEDSVSNAGSKISSVGNTVSNVGKDMTMKVTAPVVAMGTAMAHSAISFESAFAGVNSCPLYQK